MGAASGDDIVTFNADTFVDDAEDDGDDGAFDGGAGYDILRMESNNANTFTLVEQAVSNFEELELFDQDLGKADVIDLHNIGMDTVSNVTSNVGAGSVPEITRVDFSGSATANDSVTITGANGLNVTVALDGDLDDNVRGDGDVAAEIAAKVVAAFALNPNGYSAIIDPEDSTAVIITGPNGVDAELAVTFTDDTTIGLVGFEQVTGAPSAVSDGFVGDPGTEASFTLVLADTVLADADDVLTLTLNFAGGAVATFTFDSPGDLSGVGGELARFIADAANNDPAFNTLMEATVVGNNVVFTALVAEQIVAGGYTPVGAGTLVQKIIDESGFNPFFNGFVNGTPPIAPAFEVQEFTLDGIATGNDQMVFDGVTITFDDGDLPADLGDTFVQQYMAIPEANRTWNATNVGATVTLTSIAAANLDLLTEEDFFFDDDSNVGTPAAAITELQNGELASVTLENFISGSRLTLTNTDGIHTVNMKTDTDADVLNLVLEVDGDDHGVVTADDAETVNIDTGLADEGGTDTLDLFGGDLTTLVVSGENGLTLDTDSVIVSSVDATALEGFFTWSAGPNEEDITVSTGIGGSRLDFSEMAIQGGVSSTGNAPVTVLGGSGDDFIITGNAGTSRGTITTGGGEDTVVVGIVDGGNDFWTITDFDDAGGAGFEDVLLFVNEAEFVEQVQLLEPTATFQDYLDAAARGNTADGNFVDGGVSYFYFEGNTYVVQDNADAEDFVDGTDTVIRLDGIKVLGDINIGTAGEDDYPVGTPVPDMMPEVAMMDFSVV